MSVPLWYGQLKGQLSYPSPHIPVSSTQAEAGTQWLAAHGSALARAKQAKSLDKAVALHAQAHLTGDREVFLMALAL